jgi:RimJ/RimL family protein N-acetyltransferase
VTPVPGSVVMQTERVVLRSWLDQDREPFAAMNADPKVREFFESTQTREESDRSVDRFIAQEAEHGFTFWAAEVDGEFAGFIGLDVTGFDAGLPYADEIGWRLARKFWNQGLATEGARACLDYAWHTLGRERIVACAAPRNIPSRRVMEKIGMHEIGPFEHPQVEDGHPLKTHVLYEITRPEPRLK